MIGLGSLLVGVSAEPSGIVSGMVVEQDGGPVTGAVVRQQTTANSTASAADGSFTLGGWPTR